MAEFGYRMRHRGARFRRYIVKLIALDEGQQFSFDGGRLSTLDLCDQ